MGLHLLLMYKWFPGFWTICTGRNGYEDSKHLCIYPFSGCCLFVFFYFSMNILPFVGSIKMFMKFLKNSLSVWAINHQYGVLTCQRNLKLKFSMQIPFFFFTFLGRKKLKAVFSPHFKSIPCAKTTLIDFVMLFK